MYFQRQYPVLHEIEQHRPTSSYIVLHCDNRAINEITFRATFRVNGVRFGHALCQIRIARTRACKIQGV